KTSPIKTPTTYEIYTLSLHDALPISVESGNGGSARSRHRNGLRVLAADRKRRTKSARRNSVRLFDQQWRHVDNADSLCLYLRLEDRKSTRLNSSHDQISYAVFCLKKK